MFSKSGLVPGSLHFDKVCPSLALSNIFHLALGPWRLPMSSWSQLIGSPRGRQEGGRKVRSGFLFFYSLSAEPGGL